MSQHTHDREPTSPNRSGIVDAGGNILPKRVTWGERCTAISSKTKIIVVSLAALVAGTQSADMNESVDAGVTHFGDAHDTHSCHLLQPTGTFEKDGQRCGLAWS